MQAESGSVGKSLREDLRSSSPNSLVPHGEPARPTGDAHLTRMKRRFAPARDARELPGPEIYSLAPMASIGRARSACRVGRLSASRASSAVTPMISRNGRAGTYGRPPLRA